MSINLFPAIPEIFLTSTIIVLLFLEAFLKNNKHLIVTIVVLLALLILICLQVEVYNITEQYAFNNMFILDNIAQFGKLFTYFLSILIVIYGYKYLQDRAIEFGEFYIIFLSALLGLMIMVSAMNMVILYVGLELLSLSLYGLVAINKHDVKSTEAAMKYFILGALASGLLLYGISFVYGVTNGSLQLKDIFQFIAHTKNVDNPILIFALVFIVAGLMFKLGLAPFHMWVPDVYDGSMLIVTTFIGTVTKLAGLIFTLRFLVGAFSLLSDYWSYMLIALAILSLFIGNIVAIAQTNIKRMLAYSAISHMGFIALGLMTISVEGLGAIIFYIITYTIISLAGFGVLMILSKKGFECDNISDLKALSKSQPLYAGIFAIVMLSLAGLPPFVGFFAKFRVLSALIQVGYIKMAIYVVIMSLIGAFYYLRIIKVMYFEESIYKLEVATKNLYIKFTILFNTILIIFLSIFPDVLYNICIAVLN